MVVGVGPFRFGAIKRLFEIDVISVLGVFVVVVLGDEVGIEVLVASWTR